MLLILGDSLGFYAAEDYPDERNDSTRWPQGRQRREVSRAGALIVFGLLGWISAVLVDVLRIRTHQWDDQHLSALFVRESPSEVLP